MIVTIDGPASSGKTTVAKLLAKELGFLVLESGKFYRLFTYLLLKLEKDWQTILTDEERLKVFWRGLLPELEIKLKKEGTIIFFKGKVLEKELRSPEVEEAVSIVAKVPAVRNFVNDLLRELGKGKKVVAEGRDMGSVVFPEATLKVFLTADEKVRAERRARDEGRDLEKVVENIKKRDKIDSTRKTAPLKLPEGAIVIDTTHLSPEEVLKEVVKELNKRGL